MSPEARLALIEYVTTSDDLQDIANRHHLTLRDVAALNVTLQNGGTQAFVFRQLGH
jgi:hypothetical protein